MQAKGQLMTLQAGDSRQGIDADLALRAHHCYLASMPCVLRFEIQNGLRAIAPKTRAISDL